MDQISCNGIYFNFTNMTISVADVRSLKKYKRALRNRTSQKPCPKISFCSPLRNASKQKSLTKRMAPAR